ncbi:MAG: hypothetical protein K0Q63_1268 [Paenibacillus sp.]|nr:hypothetical protein [Paenibacillus sp.]
MAVTANSVREGVIAMLTARLPAYDVYGEAPASGEEPYLLVELKAMSQTPMLGGMYSRTFQFGIHYSGDGAGAADLHETAEELYEAFEGTEIGGIRYRTANMRHEVLDGKLAFGFEMTVRLRKTEQEAPKMGVLEQEAGIR